MKRVQHIPIAEKESNRLGPVPVGKINAEFPSSIVNAVTKIRAHISIAINNSGNR